MKQLQQIRERLVLLALGLGLSSGTELDVYLASKTDHCGGNCICITYDGTAPAALATTTIVEARCGICHVGSIPVTNNKCQVEAYLKGCACGNTLPNCLCIQFPGVTAGQTTATIYQVTGTTGAYLCNGADLTGGVAGTADVTNEAAVYAQISDWCCSSSSSSSCCHS